MDRHLIDAAIEHAKEYPMRWGVDDCSLWVCDLVDEATGVDLAKDLRGKYRSAAGAYRALKLYAGAGLVEAAILIAAKHGLKPAKFPWKGILVGVVSDRNGPALALHFDGHWLGRTERGFTLSPSSAGVVAWEIPKCRH